MHTSLFWTVFPYLLLAAMVGFVVGYFVRQEPKRKLGDIRAGSDTRELEHKVEAVRLQLEGIETSVERLAMLEELLQRVSLLDEHQKERAGALDRRLQALDELSQKLSAVKEAGTRLGNVQTLLGRLEDHLRTGVSSAKSGNHHE